MPTIPKPYIWWFPWEAGMTLDVATLFSWGNTWRRLTVEGCFLAAPQAPGVIFLPVWKGTQDGSQLSSQMLWKLLAKVFPWSGQGRNTKEVAWHTQLGPGVVKSWPGSHSLAIVFSYRTQSLGTPTSVKVTMTVIDQGKTRSLCNHVDRQK